MASKPHLIYCSWSSYKIEEWDHIRHVEFEQGKTYDDLLSIDFREVRTHEPLLCDLATMVHAKAISAYREVKVPCFVEHAGLILQGFESASYPGGLTQPMWDALGAEKFVATCNVLGSAAIARAIIGYCDGTSVQTFVGETKGTLKSVPSGLRQFYWDTVFSPNGFDGKTYADIADADLGEKLKVSQSVKALRQLISHCRASNPPLFPGL